MAGKHVVAIIQARLASTRLPGKVLLEVGGTPLLARVVRRTQRASRIDRVVVATSTDPSDEPIAALCQSLGVACFRGPAQDVLDRYYRAASASQADVVVRVTANCPLIDPQVIDQVVAAFEDLEPDCASNTVYPTYPRGLEVEALSMAALERAWREALLPAERIRVTPYLYEHPESFAIFPVIQSEDCSHRHWAADTLADLEFLRAVYARLGPDDSFSWRQVWRLLDDEPDLAARCRHARQTELVQG